MILPRLLACLGVLALGAVWLPSAGSASPPLSAVAAAPTATPPSTPSPGAPAAASPSTSPAPLLTPTPTATPLRHRGRYRSVFGHPATPSPSPLAPAPLPSVLPPVSPPAARVAAPVPVLAATPIPSAAVPATPQPGHLATPARVPAATVLQPTIPESMLDPDVRETLKTPLSQLRRFDWMVGTWSARNVEELPNGTSRDLGLNTYVFAYTMKKRYFFGADGKARDEFYITYDPFVFRYILIRLEGNPTYGIWTSPDGWRGNRIVFSGVFTVALGRLYQRRLTIIHKDAHDFGIYDEEQLPDGTWSADDAVELTKTQ